MSSSAALFDESVAIRPAAASASLLDVLYNITKYYMDNIKYLWLSDESAAIRPAAASARLRGVAL